MKTETSQDDVVRAEVYLHRVMAAHISEGDGTWSLSMQQGKYMRGSFQ